MTKSKLLSAVAAVAALGMASSAHAIINAPVPTNAYITYGGLQWAWASPIAADGSFGCCAIDLSYQATQGWRLPTAAEMLTAPDATKFLFAGANVPFGGVDPISGAHFTFTGGTYKGDGALAAPYFITGYTEGNFCNAPGSACGFGLVPWWGQPGAPTYAESLVVRAAGPGVPEPATWALMLLGFGAIGAMARRRQVFAA